MNTIFIVSFNITFFIEKNMNKNLFAKDTFWKQNTSFRICINIHSLPNKILTKTQFSLKL